MAVPAHDQRDYEFATKFGFRDYPCFRRWRYFKEAFCEDGKSY